MKLSILLRIGSLAIGSARCWKTVVFASVFVVFLTASVNASSVTVQYTVNVELVPGGQPAPNISLAISVFDTVSATVFTRYVRTNGQGSFSDTATFECNASNRYGYVIGGVKIRSSGAMEAGASTSSSSEDCAAPVPATPLNLAVSSLDYNFDRHNAGVGCNGYVGKPVNVTNGNMYTQHDDYFLPGNGEEIRVSRHYNSQVTDVGYFGLGWTSDIDERLVISCTGPFQCNTEFLLYYDPDGRITHFGETSTAWQYKAMNPGNYDRVERYSDWTRDLFFKDGRIHHFDNNGNLLWKRDRNGNQTTTSYIPRADRLSLSPIPTDEV